MAYSGGQALFDPQAPGALIGRTTEPFISVRTAHEITGQVGNVCFVEGLVQFKDRWLLYYGMGDSRIGVASAPAGARRTGKEQRAMTSGRSAAPARVPLLGARPRARCRDAAHARAVPGATSPAVSPQSTRRWCTPTPRSGRGTRAGKAARRPPCCRRHCSRTWRACGAAWVEHERLACTRSSRRRARSDPTRRFAYTLLSGAAGESTLQQMVQHVVNHATYHRGQVTTMLRQLGAAPPKSMDLIQFWREWEIGRRERAEASG